MKKMAADLDPGFIHGWVTSCLFDLCECVIDISSYLAQVFD